FFLGGLATQLGGYPPDMYPRNRGRVRKNPAKASHSPPPPENFILSFQFHDGAATRWAASRHHARDGPACALTGSFTPGSRPKTRQPDSALTHAIVLASGRVAHFRSTATNPILTISDQE
ncbi:MAG: hypothetical protein KBG46_14635, partial [Paracoccus sp.]|nr:hypothetical protein [Paracoccus sp. (in: a-proteobacteria)]